MKFQKCGDFFLKPWGFLKKVGIILQNVGIFEGKNWWGQVGIFGNRDGDFQPKPCGNTDNNKQKQIRREIKMIKMSERNENSSCNLEDETSRFYIIWTLKPEPKNYY